MSTCDTCYKDFTSEKEFTDHISVCIPTYKHIRLELENDTKTFFDRLSDVQNQKLKFASQITQKENTLQSSETDNLKKMYSSYFKQFTIKYENMVETYEKMLEDTRKTYTDILKEKEKEYKKRESDLLNKHAGVINSLNLTILMMKEKLDSK